MILDDLADYLSTSGIGTIGTDLFKGKMPSTPDAVVALFVTGSAPPDHRMATSPISAATERPHVAVWTRAARYDSAQKTAQDVWRLLDGYGGTINGVSYLAVYALQAPFPLEEDEARRTVVACNYEVVRVPASSS